MSSIVHVANNKMLEFHRLYGHKSFIFWRYNTKNFSDFHINDFIFFLSKTNRKKEKGIVGFGQLKGNKILKVQGLYNRYKKQLGCLSNQEFIDSLKKYSKDQETPEVINALFLEEVVFFKQPIYLSEIDVAISKQLESFIYLDQEENNTSKLLNKAQKIGLDLWSDNTLKVPLEILSNIYDITYQLKELGYYKKTQHRDFGLMNHINGFYTSKQITLFTPRNSTREQLYLRGIKDRLSESLEKYQLSLTFEHEKGLELPLTQ